MITKQTIDLSEERRLLTQLIVSTPLLIQLKDILEARLFESPFSRTIVTWILEYFEHTQQAPGKTIEEIYLRKQREIQDDETRELIAEFLRRLSQEWENNQVNNVPYALKNAIDFLKVRSLDCLKTELDQCVQNNDPKTGESVIGNYKKVERLTGSGVSILTDSKAIVRAFNYEEEHLFKFPGDLGQSIGYFSRGDFLGWLGAPKKGKTHYLWLTAHYALLAGLKTAMISLEMTEPQMLRMIWTGIRGQPVKTKNVLMPYFAAGLNDKDDIKLKEERINGVDLEKIPDFQKFYKTQLRGGDLRLLTFPATGTTFQHIRNELNNLEYYENWIPDAIIIDYADLLEPENKKQEHRHGLDSIWRALRGYAQEKYLFMATASQAGRKGLEHDIKSGDISEDVRKVAHVTKMLMLNQTEKEYEDGIIRIKTGVQREGKRNTQQIIVLQAFDIGRPYLDSRVKSRVNYGKYEEKENKKKDNNNSKE